MRAIALLLLLFAPGPANAAFNPFEGPKPIAVFIERNPWLMVMGSDTPRVAVYDSGEVIFLKKTGDSYAYRSAKLTTAELAALKQKWAPVFGAKLKRNYELSDATDQTTALLYLADGDHTVVVSAYGLDCRYAKSAADDPKGGAPPAALFQVHKALCDLDHPQSQAWVPKYVEVMLWGYDYAPQPSIHWPKEWPNLTSDRALGRGEDWSIFLDGSHLPKLESFLATQNEKGAVEVGGKKWAASFRPTFPSEPVWQQAFAATDDKK